MILVVAVLLLVALMVFGFGMCRRGSVCGFFLGILARCGRLLMILVVAVLLLAVVLFGFGMYRRENVFGLSGS